MTIGKLLKEARLKKGLSQKQFSDGIISTSYYSKVEKNDHRITAEDLIALLEHNNIPMWSFFKELSMKGDIQHEYVLDLEAEVMNAYYRSDVKKLKQIKQEIENSNRKDKENFALVVSGWIENLKEDDEAPDIEVRNALKDKIFNIDNFDHEKLSLFCNFMSFYNLEDNFMIVKNIIGKFITNNETGAQANLLAIIANLLCMSIEEKNYSYVDYLVSSAEKLPLKPQLFLPKEMICFYKFLIQYQTSKDEVNLSKCRNIIENIKLVGMTDYGNAIEDFLNKYK